MSKKGKAKKEQSPKTKSQGNSVSSPQLKELAPLLPDRILKIGFWGSMAIIAILLAVLSLKVGIPGDEPTDYEFGKVGLNYYLTMGEDTSFINWEFNGTNFDHHRFYGLGFEGTTAAILQAFDVEDPYTVRHIINALIGAVLILFTGLVAYEIGGWQAALMVIWLMFLTPRLNGLALWQTKDIPMTAGFVMSIYFVIKQIKVLPQVNWKNTFGAMAGFAFAVSVRFSAILVIVYSIAFVVLAIVFRKELQQIFKKQDFKTISKVALHFVVFIVVGFILGMFFYPNFWEGPVAHVIDTYEFNKNLKLNWLFLYNGELTRVQQLPDNFLFEMLQTFTPVITLIGIPAFLLALFMRWRAGKDILLWVFVAFGFIFPIFYLWWSGASVYSFRHVLFFYPYMALATVLGITHFMNHYHKTVRYVIIGAVSLMMLDLGVWIFSNNPFQYSYFNRMSGRTAENYLYNETDNQRLGTSICLDHLLESDDFKKMVAEKGKVTVMSNNGSVLGYQLNEEEKAKVNLVQGGFRGYASTEWDYCILSPVFMAPKLLKQFYPPTGTVFSPMVEGKPMAALIKRENDSDLRGIRAFRENKIQEALPLLEEAVQYNPNNFGVWFWLGYAYSLTQQPQKAVQYLTAHNDILGGDPNSMRVLGNVYLQLGDFQRALQNLVPVFNQQQNDDRMATMIASAYAQIGNKQEARKYIQAALRVNPNNAEAQRLAAGL